MTTKPFLGTFGSYEKGRLFFLYAIKLATRSVSGSVSMIHHRIDVNTLEHHDADELKLNEIGSCTVAVNAPVVFDPYKRNKTTGSFIVIDRLSNVTVGAGMITGDASVDGMVAGHSRGTRQPLQPDRQYHRLERRERQRSGLQTGTQAVRHRGHATTVLEHANDALAAAIKNAGLLCLCLDGKPPATDIDFNCDENSVDDIYGALKNRGVIH